jgi:hypothetical protein
MCVRFPYLQPSGVWEDKLSTPTTDVPDESYKMIFLILITMSQQ